MLVVVTTGGRRVSDENGANKGYTGEYRNKYSSTMHDNNLYCLIYAHRIMRCLAAVGSVSHKRIHLSNNAVNELAR